MLNIIDEFTRECIAIRVNRRLKATDVIDVLSDLFILLVDPHGKRPEVVATIAEGRIVHLADGSRLLASRRGR